MRILSFLRYFTIKKFQVKKKPSLRLKIKELEDNFMYISNPRIYNNPDIMVSGALLFQRLILCKRPTISFTTCTRGLRVH